MYTRQQASQLKQEFWTAFGRYMQPVPNAAGERINWVNYKTGVRQVFFRMDADGKQAVTSIRITHSDETERMLCYERFVSLRKLLQEALKEDWEWEPHTTDAYGKPMVVISKTLSGVNVFMRDSWPQIISFFKPRIIALDEFWLMVKDAFE